MPMVLSITFDAPGLADGLYQLHAPGFSSASLHWADADGALPGFTSLALIPVDAEGCGTFRLRGGRAVPPGATHVLARMLSPAGMADETSFPIPHAQRQPPFRPDVRFCVMSDLHLAAKPGRIRRALQQAAAADCILLPGDLTNDAAPGQFAQFRQLIEETCGSVPVLAVNGNHDQPLHPLPLIPQGTDSWLTLQDWLLARAGGLGVSVELDASGAWRASFRGVSIYGLNAATHRRRLTMARSDQPQRLDAWLSADRSPMPRLVLCHAPLMAHNPVRTGGSGADYLAGDQTLQQVIDRQGRVVFLSGHTHITLNESRGCAELDAGHDNLYMNDGSVCPTVFREREPLTDREHLEGCLLWLDMGADGLRITGQTLSGGRQIARGCYRF